MKIPEKFYVSRNYRSTEEVLGFMVVADAEHTKAFEKKKATADRWSNGKLPAIYVDNKPKTGFQIVTNVSRYSTSNVVWRVLHPEGFEFEITSHNFCDLIQTSTVIDGAIQEELFFTENRMLVSSKTKLYAELIKQEEKKEQQKELISEFVPGDKFKFAGEWATSYKNNEYLYCGSYHMLVMNKNKPLCIPEKSSKKEVIMNLATGKLMIRTKISDREIEKSGFQEVDRGKVIEKLNDEYRDHTAISTYNYDPLADYYVLSLCGDNKPFKRDACTVEYSEISTKSINSNISALFVYMKLNNEVVRIFGACKANKGYYSSNDKSEVEMWSNGEKLFGYPAELNENGQLLIPDVDLNEHQGFTGYRNKTPFKGLNGYRNEHKNNLKFIDIPDTIMLGKMKIGK